MSISFKITAKQGRARTGELQTSHGLIHTPTITTNFTPALLRSGLITKDLGDLGVEMVLVNVLHSYIAGVKDVHKYLNWGGSIFCDSGGFQMVSLGEKSKIHWNGANFELDGKKYKLTPEIVASLQKDMGVDIIMPLDRVITVFSKNFLDYFISVLTTMRWFPKAHKISPDNTYYITQGGLNYTARSLSLWDANRWLNKGVPGVAIGGIALGESSTEMLKMTKFCTDRLLEDKPRHLLGVGTPIELLEAIDLGIDTFDCVAATREARHNRLWTSSGYLRLSYTRHKNDNQIIEIGCDCPACFKGTTRAQLIADISHSSVNDSLEKKAKRAQALRMCMLHNIRFVMRLMEQAREAIRLGEYQRFKQEFIKKFCPG